MSKIYAAQSVAVNGPDAPFLLTKDQLWQALQRKIRHAGEFVPAMRSCKVVKDEGNDFVIRDTVLEQPDGKLRHMREEVTSVGKQWIIFRQHEGSVTTNLLSQGDGHTDKELILTYIFEWNFLEVGEGAEERERAIAGVYQMAHMAAKYSVDTARKLVESGKIK